MLRWTDYEDSFLWETIKQNKKFDDIKFQYDNNPMCSARTDKAIRKRIYRLKMWHDNFPDSLKELETHGCRQASLNFQYDDDPVNNSQDRTKVEYWEDLEVLRVPFLNYVNNKPRSYNDISRNLIISDQQIDDLIQLLSKDGIIIREDRRMVFYSKNYSEPQIIKPYVIDDVNPSDFRFGIVSDTHFGSRYAKIDDLWRCYSIFRSMGVKYVLHGGDVLDGSGVYKSQHMEVTAYSFEEQLKLLINQYPQYPGITTLFITGNHDESFADNHGISVGPRIQAVRPDMIFLGSYSGIVQFPDYKVKLQHGNGAGAYTKSYKLQCDLRDDRTKDLNMYILGHFHQLGTIPRINTVDIAMYAGAFQGQSNFARKKKLPPCSAGIYMRIMKELDNHITTQKYIEFDY